MQRWQRGWVGLARPPAVWAGWVEEAPAQRTGQLACVKALTENSSHCLGAATAAAAGAGCGRQGANVGGADTATF